MAGINTGILYNAVPLSSGAIKELERKVIENNGTFAYLDENGELCFSIPWGIDGIKDLAWHNAYELSNNGESLLKKHYKKSGYDTFELAATMQKTTFDDEWNTENEAHGRLVCSASGLIPWDLDGYVVTLEKVVPPGAINEGDLLRVLWNGDSYEFRVYNADYYFGADFVFGRGSYFSLPDDGITAPFAALYYGNIGTDFATENGSIHFYIIGDVPETVDLTVFNVTPIIL